MSWMDERVEDSVQLFVLDQKPVVSEGGVDLMVGAARQHPVQRLHFGHGEDDIGRNADDQTFGRDSLQRRCHASALVADVVRVESVEDLVIGVGIITPAELFSLVLLVGAGPVRGEVVALVLLREVVAFRPPVREQPDSPRRRESLHAGGGVRFPEGRVGFDGHALRFVDGDAPGRRFGSRGDQDQLADPLGLLDGPFDRLKAADGAADQGVDAVNAQNVGQQPVGPYHVADRQFGEILVIGASGRRIDVQRPGRAVVRAEDVGADDEMLGGVEEFARLDRVRPPRGHVRIGGQGVADPDDIVVGRIQFPVGAECDRQFGQNASPLQFERLVMTVYIHCVYSRFNALPISSFRSSMCSMPSEKRSMLG